MTSPSASDVPRAPRRCPAPATRQSRTRGRRLAVAATASVGAVLTLGACSHQSAMQGIDDRVTALMSEGSRATNTPAVPDASRRADDVRSSADLRRERPATVNPTAESLAFESRAATDAQEVIDRLDAYAALPSDALSMSLNDALEYAVQHSREFRFAEEEYVLASLRLLIERHRWGPRFFDEVSATVSGDPDDGTYDTALSIVNELGVTQRLPYGGSVSASLLARATEDLHQRVAGENVQSASFLLSANIPLLRGAGWVAREDRIQAERDLIYAARDFERFRREFLFDIAVDYLDLVVAARRIEIAEDQVASFEQLEEQQIALQEEGRATSFDADEARNETLEAIDSLNNSRESLRLAIDRFKVRLGMPTEVALTIQEETLGLETPATTLDSAVIAAMDFRLDLQTQRDVLDDQRRALLIARDQLRGDLDLFGSITMPTDPDLDRAGLQFEPDETQFSAGITYGLPLDREIERLQLRQAQIALARAERTFDRFRDDIAITVRAAVRGIDAAAFSDRIQQENVRIAESRKAAIDAEPARANVRQRTDSINQLARAQASRDDARRSLDVAILSYLLQTGQLRVTTTGRIDPLDGMVLGRATPPAVDPATGVPDPSGSGAVAPGALAESTESADPAESSESAEPAEPTAASDHAATPDRDRGVGP